MVVVSVRLIVFLAVLMALLDVLGRFFNPHSGAARLLERGLLGILLLAGWNFLTAGIGLSLGINPLSSLIAGCLGIPGFALLEVIRLL